MIILLLAWVPVSEAQPQFQQVIEVTVSDEQMQKILAALSR